MVTMEQLVRFAFATQPTLPHGRHDTALYTECLRSIVDAYRLMLNTQHVCNIRHFRNWSDLVERLEILTYRNGD